MSTMLNEEGYSFKEFEQEIFRMMQIDQCKKWRYDCFQD